mmetsp:Transcript_28792/g.54372  ORF Transcript_28792/g.54372 Transcript_28792/m.54372 type:complete len:276 (+) Transcript_28792:1053-1880(+)
MSRSLSSSSCRVFCRAVMTIFSLCLAESIAMMPSVSSKGSTPPSSSRLRSFSLRCFFFADSRTISFWFLDCLRWILSGLRGFLFTTARRKSLSSICLCFTASASISFLLGVLNCVPLAPFGLSLSSLSLFTSSSSRNRSLFSTSRFLLPGVSSSAFAGLTLPLSSLLRLSSSFSRSCRACSSWRRLLPGVSSSPSAAAGLILPLSCLLRFSSSSWRSFDAYSISRCLRPGVSGDLSLGRRLFFKRRSRFSSSLSLRYLACSPWRCFLPGVSSFTS